MILLPSIFFFIRIISNKKANKDNNVIIIPKIDWLYKLAPIEFQMIIPGILDKQYIVNVLKGFSGVSPAPYIKTSLGTKGKLQNTNNDIKPVLELKNDTILSKVSFLTNLLINP